MNKELIQKFLNKACWDEQAQQELEDWLNVEMFAELIVLECNYLIQQQVSLKYKDGWEQSGLSDDWACGHYAAASLSRTVIKQHFGVKE